MNKAELKQEIVWLKEEISADEALIGSKDFSGFHAERLEENQNMLSMRQCELHEQYGEEE